MVHHTNLIFVDAHVHIHDCFDLPLFLDSAAENFGLQKQKHETADTYIGVLLLTEARGVDWFGRLVARSQFSSSNRRIGKWHIQRTGEPHSLLAIRDSAEKMLIISGRQIVTAESLEVLALCTDYRFEDGKPLTETAKSVRTARGLVVIPWGTGKWWGKRGKILQQFLESQAPNQVFLGDNGGRPIFWRNPVHFKHAKTRGIRILPGSDPLPFSSECVRAGSFGFALTGKVNLEYPAADIKRMLLEPTTKLRPYGLLERPYRFFRNQIAMQLRKTSKHRVAQ